MTKRLEEENKEDINDKSLMPMIKLNYLLTPENATPEKVLETVWTQFFFRC